MKSIHATLSKPTHAVLLGGLLLALTLAASPGHATGSSPEIAAVPVYQPPVRGAPASRIGGASRGAQVPLILEVLAPDRGVGLTRHTRPTVYWYVSTALTRPLEVTLIDDHAIKAQVETTVTAARPGIHALRLDYPLEPGVEYRWSVAAVADPGQRAGDTLASGTIQHEPPPAALAARLDRASPRELPFLYAEHGYWYDAIAALSEQIATHPEDRQLRSWRAALLRQVGLGEVAAYYFRAMP